MMLRSAALAGARVGARRASSSSAAGRVRHAPNPPPGAPKREFFLRSMEGYSLLGALAVGGGVFFYKRRAAARSVDAEPAAGAAAPTAADVTSAPEAGSPSEGVATYAPEPRTGFCKPQPLLCVPPAQRPKGVAAAPAQPAGDEPAAPGVYLSSVSLSLSTWGGALPDLLVNALRVHGESASAAASAAAAADDGGDDDVSAAASLAAVRRDLWTELATAADGAVEPMLAVESRGAADEPQAGAGVGAGAVSTATATATVSARPHAVFVVAGSSPEDTASRAASLETALRTSLGYWAVAATSVKPLGRLHDAAPSAVSRAGVAFLAEVAPASVADAVASHGCASLATSSPGPAAASWGLLVSPVPSAAVASADGQVMSAEAEWVVPSSGQLSALLADRA